MKHLFYFSMLICLGACALAKKSMVAPLTGFKFQGVAQGTTYQVTYFATDSLITKKHFDAVFNSIDSSLSIYKSYSLISQFNNSDTGVELDHHLKQVIEKSLVIYTVTQGMADITVYPLVREWGFGTKKVTIVPDSNIIKAILPCVGANKIFIDGNKLVKKMPCVKIDVNGIGQGYTVDVIAQLLDDHQIKNYLVEVGGELRVKGSKQPGNVPFTVGIESPDMGNLQEPVLRRILQLKQGAVTTSGNYRRYYESNGKTISHLVNPFTGYPVQNELISVTVYAADAITADGYDNALMGMGLNNALAFLAMQTGIEAHFIYHTPGGAVADTATKGFNRLFGDGERKMINDAIDKD